MEFHSPHKVTAALLWKNAINSKRGEVEVGLANKYILNRGRFGKKYIY